MGIKIFRGNTATFVIPLQQTDGTPYVPTETDVLRFTIKRQPLRRLDIMYEKYMTFDDYSEEDGGYTFRLLPEDTAEWPADTYSFDCALSMSEEEFYTVVEPQPFVLSNVVSEYGDEDGEEDG